MTKEDYKLMPLAAAGLAGGLFKYYVKPEITSKRTWIAIGAIVAAHEFACGPGEVIS